MIIEQLIDNSVFPNETQIAFARKRTPSTERGAYYHVESKTEKFGILLSVNLSGNVIAAVSRDMGYISDGLHESNDEYEPIHWSDTNNVAIVKTDLTKEDIDNGISPSEVMKRYLESINREDHALCQGGYSQWKLQMQLYTNMLAQARSTHIEMNLLMTKTTCPGMEYSQPWMPPFYEIMEIKGDKASPVKITSAEEARFNDINEACRPRSSSLRLNPPFMTRNQIREIFHSEGL